MTVTKTKKRCAECGAEHPWGKGANDPGMTAECRLWKGELCVGCWMTGGCPICEGGSGSACSWHFV